MIAKRGALIIASFLLLFVAVNIIASMLPSFGVNIGPIMGGISPESSKETPNENCKCEFDLDLEDFACNSDCGDKVGTFCGVDEDCTA